MKKKLIGENFKIDIILIGVTVFFITFLHYYTPTTIHYLHEIYKVLYFIPIILAAFFRGFKGGITTSLVISFLYFPHIMIQWGGPVLLNLSRLFMIVLYNLMAGLTGYLWEKEKTERIKSQKTSDQLKVSLLKLEQVSEELASIESQLRSAERLSTLGELTASLAHEIRNPLGSIQGVAEILRDESQTENNKKFIDILLQETQRLESVVANYLSYAKPKQIEEKKKIDLYKVVDSVATLLGHEARKRAVSFEIKSDHKNVQFEGREGLIRQAILNILINAVQASQANGKINITILQNNKAIAFECSDDGPGILEQDLNKIFDPFFTTKNDGTGLGLAITKRIINEHDGTIEIKPKKDHGTIVRVEFPNA